MSRRIARECAYKLIFEELFHFEDGPTNENKKNMLVDEGLTDIDKKYIDKVTKGVKAHFDELSLLIENNLKNFRLDRIFKPDLSALLLACYEMKYEEDIPLKVSICSILDLVQIYSTEKSKLFVNGVLAGVYRDLIADPTVVKTPDEKTQK